MIRYEIGDELLIYGERFKIIDVMGDGHEATYFLLHEKDRRGRGGGILVTDERGIKERGGQWR